jgi:hypothetical protein
MISLRQFGFKDEDFLKDAFDPLTRRSLMIELLSIRKGGMSGFYGMFIGGVLFGLMALVTPKPTVLGLMVCSLFVALMCLANSLHADVKYKLVSVLARLSEGESRNVT